MAPTDSSTNLPFDQGSLSRSDRSIPGDETLTESESLSDSDSEDYAIEPPRIARAKRRGNEPGKEEDKKKKPLAGLIGRTSADLLNGLGVLIAYLLTLAPQSTIAWLLPLIAVSVRILIVWGGLGAVLTFDHYKDQTRRFFRFVSNTKKQVKRWVAFETALLIVAALVAGLTAYFTTDVASVITVFGIYVIVLLAV